MEIKFSKKFKNTPLYSDLINDIIDNDLEAFKSDLEGTYEYEDDNASIYLVETEYFGNSIEGDGNRVYLSAIKNDPFVYAIFKQKPEFLDILLEAKNFPINPNLRIKLNEIFDKNTRNLIDKFIKSQDDEELINMNRNNEMTISNLLMIFSEVGLIDKDFNEKYLFKISQQKEKFLKHMGICNKDIYCYSYEGENFYHSDFHATFEGMINDLILTTNYKVLRDKEYLGDIIPDKHNVLVMQDYYNMSKEDIDFEVYPLNPDFFDYDHNYSEALIADIPGKGIEEDLEDKLVDFITNNREQLINHYLGKAKEGSDNYNTLLELKNETKSINERKM